MKKRSQTNIDIQVAASDLFIRTVLDNKRLQLSTVSQIHDELILDVSEKEVTTDGTDPIKHR